jgi:hypothetical protein
MAPRGKGVEIKELALEDISFTVEGLSPLIVHRWSEKARKQMLAKQMKEVVTKEAKNPEEQFRESLYTLDGDKPAFPADAFKAAAVRGGKSLGIVMTDAKSAFFVHGEYSERDLRDLVPLKGPVTMREDMVRLENGVADIRYRAQVHPWSAVIRITYNSSVLSKEQIVNMFNAGGFGCGVGEWRPSNGGTFGRFNVKTTAKSKGA